LSARVAAALWEAMDARLSFVVTAVPRFAGKSTSMNALLGLLPPDVLVHRLDGSPEQMRRLKGEASGGYLVAAEIGQAPVPDYIWGEPVRELFETLAAGYSLATALHAPDVAGTFDVLCRENGVSDEGASRVNLVLHLLRLGDEPDSFWRRLAQVSEIHDVSGGRPNTRVLFRWREQDDTFEDVESPDLLRIDSAELDGRARAIEERVRSGRTDGLAVSELVGRNSP
jgi:type IV secretory pathway ATPase VirB11/archaellum biosynthesis ATPase